MGWHIPPTHFQSVLGLFLVNGTFWVVVCIVMSLCFERRHVLEMTLLLGFVGGVVVGLLCRVIYRFYKWRLGLPRWADYNPYHEADAEDAGW
jgi:hypothetical protein